MPKELAAFPKQDTRIELMEERRRKVEYAGWRWATEGARIELVETRRRKVEYAG
jgi:hypothetical protein